MEVEKTFYHRLLHGGARGKKGTNPRENPDSVRGRMVLGLLDERKRLLLWEREVLIIVP